MEKRDLLFELRTEELPPRTLQTLSTALTEGIVKGLDAAGIAHGKVRGFATPRRLAALVSQCADAAPDRQVERRGPPVANAFDAEGLPTQAASAFARNCGIPVGELERLVTDKGAWLVFRGTERGASTVALLAGILHAAIAALPIARRMRWGAGATEFVRPVHGAVLLYGEEVVPVDVLGLATDRLTVGHRFHAPRPITLKSAKSYESRLKSAKVVADFAVRREQVRAGVAAAAQATGGTALIEEALLDEVTALVEWPVPITGRFEERFLALPREVVIATIQDHQRYFAIEGPDGKLTGGFVTVSNIQSREPDRVREGNERVVRPRLRDAAFFWDQDRKVPLELRAAELKGVTFQAKLGSYADKTARVKSLAVTIGQAIGAGTGVGAAAELAKADLLTAMVGEFPELQGIMGRYYAQAEGYPEEVSRAIEEHYRPRFAGDALPSSRIGQALALADKIDTLAGIFSIEQRPTGAKDPFGLRRAALGVLRILLECRLDLDLVALIDASAAAQPVQRAQTSREVSEFIDDRLRGLLIERADGITTEMVEAVLANRPVSPVDAEARLRALREFLILPDAGVLAAINKRIANILRKAPPDKDTAVRPQVFSEAEGAEARLHRVVGRLADSVGEAVAARRYADTLKALIELRAPVDDFFERIMVMDENPERRANRLALLRDVQRLLGSVADLSRLPG
ncbi:MAG TPA: glycine--tRNA ligase subunit beta [Steroidobacteraceae bacterium]|jgi:glycyl-tRNA synthetase beta chain|nr:glycine--tRNA ligase subunit beta [Steroidobacteraceae bacterium]